MSRRQHSDQLATLTAHAAQLQTRLLVALDTLDSQSLAHTSEIAALQEAHDKLVTRARRLEYERNTAHEDLAEMTAVLELVIEKVSAANDYKVLAHSNLRLPAPLSPPRARSSTGSRRAPTHPHTSTDASAYTTALVSALTAQLDAARAQAARERADAERKIARLEAMVELRDVELRRNLGKSANGAGENKAESSTEAVASGSDAGTSAWRSSGMSRGEALSAYEAVAKDNERLERDVSRLRAELASSDFNRATSEVASSSSWAQIPDWARPQPQAQPSEKPVKPKRTRQSQSQQPPQSTSSDHAPSSTSDHRVSSSSFELNAPRRASSSATADPNRSRTPRHASVFSGSESERGSAAGAASRPRQEQNAGMSRPPRRSGLRDSGFGADSGTDTTRATGGVAKPTSSTKTKIGTRDRERERRASEREAPEQSQQRQTDPTNTPTQQQDTITSSQLMPLLPALTPSKVRAPRVEAIDLPSTSYIEPSFGIHLSRRGTGRPTESDASTLEPPRTATLGPVRSPGTVSPIGELVLPPSVVSCGRSETGEEHNSLVAPVSMDSRVLLPSSLSQSPSMLSVETACATTLQPPSSPSPNPVPVSGLVASPAATPALSLPLQPQAPNPIQPAPILQPIPSLFRAPPLPSLNLPAQRPQRSRSSSRTARLPPTPVFDLTGLPAYEAVPGASSAPSTKINLGQILDDPTNPSSPTRRRSDPAPVSSPGSPHLVRQRSNSAQPLRAESSLDAPPSTPPRSTNNTAQFAFITPVLDRTVITGTEDPPAVGVGNQTSTAAELGTTIPGSISLGNTTATAAATASATNPENISNANTTGRRRLLPLFKFISPSPGTPPSTKKRRSNRSMTAPSQFGTMGSAGPGSPMGIASSPLARGRVVRESPLQLVMGAAHAATREGMRIPVMREVGGSAGTVGLVPPLVPSAPLVPLVAQLVPIPGASTEAQTAVRGMQAERELLGRAQQQPGPPKQVTAESMAKVLLIEAECLRLRRDSAETAALRREVMMLRSQLRERGETGSGIVESIEQDYTTTTLTSQASDISESAETYSNADAESDDTVPTATEATLPEAHEDLARRRLSEVERGLRNARAELDTKERAVAELKLRLAGA